MFCPNKRKLGFCFFVISAFSFVIGLNGQNQEKIEDILGKRSVAQTVDALKKPIHDDVVHDDTAFDFNQEKVIEQARNKIKSKKAHNLLQFDELCLDEYTYKEVMYLVESLKRGRKKYSPHGLLLYGPTGVGKTTLARIIAKEGGYDIIETCASNFVTMYQGSGAGNVRSAFEEAQNSSNRVVLFIDEIEAIGRTDIKPMNTHEYDNAIKTFWSELDACKTKYPHVFVIVACNDYENLDARVKRRFIKNTLKIDLPGYCQRKAIIKHHVHSCDKEISDSICWRLTLYSYGWSGSDLQLMIEDAAQKSGDEITLSYERLTDSLSKIRRNKKEGAKKDSILHMERSAFKQQIQVSALTLGISGTIAVMGDLLAHSIGSNDHTDCFVTKFLKVYNSPLNSRASDLLKNVLNKSAGFCQSFLWKIY